METLYSNEEQIYAQRLELAEGRITEILSELREKLQEEPGTEAVS